MTQALESRIPSGAMPLARAGAEQVRPATWGLLAPLTLTAACGLLALSFAFTLVHTGSPFGPVLYWLSFLVVAVPIVLRLTRREPATRERIGLAVVLGLAFYLIRVLRSPDGFTGYDELQHLRTLNDIVATGSLFEVNPLLTVSPGYPGLEILVAAVVQVAGVEPYAAATVALGGVRVLFAVGLFALYRAASSSDRVAGLAAAVYMLNPSFMFFDGQFAYQTLALTLVPVLLVGVAHLARRDGPTLLWLPVLAIVATIVVTHHVTSFAVTALLAVWLVIRLALGSDDRLSAPKIGIVAVATGVASVAWLLLVAPITLRYLGAPAEAALTEMIRLIQTGQGRPLFQSATGEVAAAWERIVALAVSAMLIAAIPIGLAVLWQRLRGRSLALLLALLSLGYPLSLVGRLLPTGSEAAGRSLATIYLGLAFVVALAVVELLDAGPQRIVRGSRRLHALVGATVARVPGIVGQAGLVAAIAATTVAGVVLGTAPATRFPGPYLVEADTRSIEAQSLGAAAWLRATLGPDVPIAADRVNRLLLGSYGEADVAFHGSRGVETWQVFLSPGVGDAEIARLREAGIRYVLIDRRLSSGLPLARFYYEEGEIYEGPHEVPISPDVLTKWDDAPGVHRIFDSGPIQIYDVGRLVDA